MKRTVESPFADDTASLHIRPKKMTFRKEEFEVFEYYYVCNVTRKEFATAEAGDITLNQLYNQYREKNNIMFPVEIKELREKYDLSSAKMSEILGFGINIYRNYENGEVPNKSNANILELAQEPGNFLKLAKESNTLTPAELETLKNKVDLNTLNYDSMVKKIIRIYNDDINRYSGYTKKDFDKIGNMVLFFISKNDTTFKTRLNKYLFYSDFLNYKYTGYSMSGFVYDAFEKGPVPDSYETLYDILEKQGYFTYEEIELDNKEFTKLIPAKEINFSKFNDEEIDLLNYVLNKLQFKQTSVIIEETRKLRCCLDNISAKNSISYQKYAFEIEL